MRSLPDPAVAAGGEGVKVGVGRLWRKKDRPGTLRSGTSADVDHLTDFFRTRAGVEAYVEPRTAVTDTTVLLVAATGEWTRRRVSGPDAATALAKKLGVPLYDPVKVGYPRRMREWTARRKAAGEPDSSGLADQSP